MADSKSAGIRYAPEDPSLPKPWRGLVDGKTGYIYYWNPETKVTQYQKPSCSQIKPDSPNNSVSESLCSSVQVQQSSQVLNQEIAANDDDDKNGRGSGGRPKFDPGEKNDQGDRKEADQPNIPHDSGGSREGRSSDRVEVLPAVRSGPSAESYRRQHEITVTGDNVPPPFTSFQAIGLPSEILREVLKAGFSHPTPIQAQSWSIAFQSRDIVAIAKTGSGKTLGYLLPAFRHLMRCRNNPQLGPTVLVLSPTRELATQIQDEAVKFGGSSKISSTCLYGGAPKGPQLRDLDRGTHIVVATPGRLNDILQMGRVNLGQISYMVLDEADRMLDMGFEPQIRKIVKEIPARRQTLMYTATWPKEVRKIAADLLVKPVQVNIGNVDELVANKSITQHVEIISSMEKQRRVEQIVRSQEPGSKIIIFCSTKRMCDQLSRNLSHQFGAAAIHGDKNQSERDHVLNQFRTGKSPILVATDVAARGLDVKDIRVVVNYDFPTGIEDYVHRIGRTGRAGSTGVAHTFFNDQDAKHASDLIKILEGANQRVPDEIRDMASRGGFGNSRSRWGSGRGYDSGYGGRDGVARGSERESQDSDKYGSGGYDVDAPGSYHAKSFHQSMIQDLDKQRSRSRSPDKGGYDANTLPGSYQAKSFHESMVSRPEKRSSRSPNGSGSGDRGRSRSRSRSVDRFDSSSQGQERSPTRSFHRAMMERS
ncbi:ATP-dependent RNA helicase-like protein DB10 [Daucus carota subsp. sativus]|uniref:ATP-dependent RNA helicase-like protein DB10 n=1 Tax=Daucus carota subsp. sativus TaxID=79200 RepID=UPI0007B20457|nr:PREDICTED: ATP-dependent RNA helicase-like protein DB10 [Daucus carota subsp. sativus]